MVLGQEIQLTLRAAEKPLAENQPRTNGDLRLDDVIARAKRVDARIKEDLEPHLLIVF